MERVERLLINTLRNYFRNKMKKWDVSTGNNTHRGTQTCFCNSLMRFLSQRGALWERLSCNEMSWATMMHLPIYRQNVELITTKEKPNKLMICSIFCSRWGFELLVSLRHWSRADRESLMPLALSSYDFMGLQIKLWQWEKEFISCYLHSAAIFYWRQKLLNRRYVWSHFRVWISQS